MQMEYTEQFQVYLESQKRSSRVVILDHSCIKWLKLRNAYVYMDPRRFSAAIQNCSRLAWRHLVLAQVYQFPTLQKEYNSVQPRHILNLATNASLSVNGSDFTLVLQL
jgi:hypothetical protein